MERKSIKLGYGNETIIVEIPHKNLADVISPDSRKGIVARYGMIDLAVSEALEQTVKTSQINLSHFVNDRSVCCMIEDCTRKEPHRDIMETLALRLESARFVRFIVATGAHNPKDQGNKDLMDIIKQAAEEHKLEYEVDINDARGADENFECVGVSTNGNKIWVNRAALYDDKSRRFERRVIVADMKPHYFAGYSNALKNGLPAVCRVDTIERNHALALDPRSTFGVHPWHYDEARHYNPLANEILEAFRLIEQDFRNVYTIAMVCSGNRIVWAKASDIKTATADGMSVVDDLTEFTVKPADYIIVSPGGYPNDREIYTAQRSLELTKEAVIDGGEILWVAKFIEGIAVQEAERKNFYDPLVGEGALEKVLAMDKRNYKLYSHKAYKFAELISRVEGIHVYSSLAPNILTDIHMNPTDNPQKVIDGWLKAKPDARILVFDSANKLAVYRE